MICVFFETHCIVLIFNCLALPSQAADNTFKINIGIDLKAKKQDTEGTKNTT